MSKLAAIPSEVEAKFECDAATRDALLRVTEIERFRVSGSRRKHQDDIYYDTAADALKLAGSTLRVRRLPDSMLVTFKGPRDASRPEQTHVAVRAEDEVALPADRAAAIAIDRPLVGAEELSPVGRARAAGADGLLVPIARLENEREAIDLIDPDGNRVEMSVDRCRGTRLRDGRVVTFGEVELEAKIASREVLSRLQAALQERFPGLRPSLLTKLGRTMS